MIRKLAGRKRGKGLLLNSSYIIYDSCNKCPLSNYIDLICNDRLESLIVSGNPSKEVLELAKVNLIIDFSELSGNYQAKSNSDLMREIYFLRSQIEGIKIATSLLQSHPDKAFEYFASIGLMLNRKNDLDKVISRIRGFASDKIRRYKKAVEKYNAMSKDDETKVTEQDFNEQLASLSKHNGFRITKSISLAEYAAYLKEYSQFINRKEWQQMKV